MEDFHGDLCEGVASTPIGGHDAGFRAV
jgi:hypothetical protein